MGTVSRILTPAEATSLQTALNAHGAHLEVDGHFGELSHLALIRFQHDNNLPETGNPDLVTCSALGIAPITTPAPAPPPKLTPNPIVQAIGALAFSYVLNKLTKGLIPMNILAGQKTIILGVVTVIVGALALIGWDIPGFNHVPGGLTIDAGLGMIFLRLGIKNAMTDLIEKVVSGLGK